MSAQSTSSKKTIVIIGAGVSGLQAARTILTHPNATSYDVVIFEARNRIGGRVQTKRQWGFPLDFGMSFNEAANTRCQFHSRHRWKSNRGCCEESGLNLCLQPCSKKIL